jgi:hypothetical protein
VLISEAGASLPACRPIASLPLDTEDFRTSGENKTRIVSPAAHLI